MDTIINDKDFELLHQDKYTFLVLDRILRNTTDLILTDHQNMIICHSNAAYPVWIWTRNNCPETVKEEVWKLICKHRPLDKGFKFNIKYELADYFIEKAEQSGFHAAISMGLFAYDCQSAVKPEKPSDGKLYCCTPEDMEEAVSLVSAFYPETGQEKPSYEHCLEVAQKHIDDKALFFWKNDEGITTSCCYYNRDPELSSISGVYTKPEYRRKHYAQHLVHEVTEIIQTQGSTPMLYTDADYAASNACYTKIGYTLRGRLCTVAATSQG